MDDIANIAMLITTLGAVLRAFPMLRFSAERTLARRLPTGTWVLITFLVAVIAFGGFSAYHYWSRIVQSQDTFMLAGGLYLTMLGGMIAQVLASNHRAGRELFDVSASQLIFPMLFAFIVFYPIWIVAGSDSNNMFAFYAAFLNGYFWESVVSTVRAPAAVATTASSSPQFPTPSVRQPVPRKKVGIPKDDSKPGV